MDALVDKPRVLLEAALGPVQGSRFQPTGFPDLGAATYTAPDGTEMLLVESVQSMANRLEAVCWDEAQGKLVQPIDGLPYVEAELPAGRSTNSILEAHRLNSPYIMSDDRFRNLLQEELGSVERGPLDLRKLAKVVFKYDTNSILHGLFLEKVSGRLSLQRCLSAFIEARGVGPVESGGVKDDVVDPSGKWGGGAALGYGNVPFHKREFTAKAITAYFSLDLAQLRGYSLGEPAERLLTALALYKIRRFLNVGLRLRTACDLKCDGVKVSEPEGFSLPTTEELEALLKKSIGECARLFAEPRVTHVKWEPTKKRKESEEPEEEKDEETAE